MTNIYDEYKYPFNGSKSFRRYFESYAALPDVWKSSETKLTLNGVSGWELGVWSRRDEDGRSFIGYSLGVPSSVTIAGVHLQTFVVNHKCPIIPFKRLLMGPVRANRTYRDNLIRHCALEENGHGYLDEEGGLEVSFEIQVGYAKIGSRMLFNIYDKLTEHCFEFVFEGCHNGMRRTKKLYANSRLLHHHSPVLARLIDCGVNKFKIVGRERYEHYEAFLQLLHGLPNDDGLEKNKMGVFNIAKRFQVDAISKKFEACRLSNLEGDVQVMIHKFRLTQFNPNHLNNVNDISEMKRILQCLSIEELPLETLKKITKKMFQLAPKELNLTNT